MRRCIDRVAIRGQRLGNADSSPEVESRHWLGNRDSRELDRATCRSLSSYRRNPAPDTAASSLNWRGLTRAGSSEYRHPCGGAARRTYAGAMRADRQSESPDTCRKDMRHALVADWLPSACCTPRRLPIFRRRARLRKDDRGSRCPIFAALGIPDNQPGLVQIHVAPVQCGTSLILIRHTTSAESRGCGAL